VDSIEELLYLQSSNLTHWLMVPFNFGAGSVPTRGFEPLALDL